MYYISETFLDADLNQESIISLDEINSYIAEWKVSFDVSLTDVIDLIHI